MKSMMNRISMMAAGLVIGLGAVLPALAVEDEMMAALWKDPTFKKQFLGSYGFNAEIEPRVSAEERDQLEKVFTLMSTDPARSGAAAKQLETITKNESSAVFDFTLGNIYFQQDRTEDAAKRLRIAIAKFPSFRRAHHTLGLIHLRAGDYDEAIKSFTKVIELGGAEGFTYGLLGYAYTARENFVAAESAYRQAALLQPDNLDWKLGLTRCILHEQKHAEAIVLLNELIDKRPDRVELWLLQANAYLGLKEPLKAAENYEFLSRAGKATWQSLASLGDIYVNQGLYDLAASAYTRAMAADPNQKVDLPLRAAEIFAARGALPQAKQVIESIQQHFSNRLEEADRRKLLKLQARVAVAEGAGDEAAKVLEEIVALDPLDGEALLLLGQHYSRTGGHEKAAFYFERAASLEAYEPIAKLRQAQLLVSQSKYQEAIPLLRRVQELKPQDDVARYLDQVERIAKARR